MKSNTQNEITGFASLLKINPQKIVIPLLCALALIICVLGVPAFADILVITDVSISYDAPAVYPGMSVPMLVETQGEVGHNPALTWSVTGQASPATVIDDSGVLSIAPGETSAELSVKAVSVQDPEIFDEITIPVAPLPSAGDLIIIPGNMDLVAGKSHTVTFRLQFAGTDAYFDHPALVWSVTGSPAKYYSISAAGVLSISDTSKAPSSAEVTVRYSWETEPLYDMSSAVNLLPSSDDRFDDAVNDYEDAIQGIPTVPNDVSGLLDMNDFNTSVNALAGVLQWDEMGMMGMYIPMSMVLGVSALCYIVFGKKE